MERLTSSVDKIALYWLALLIRSLHKQPNRAIGSGGEQPGLGRVEEHLQDRLAVYVTVATEHLERDDEGVAHQVVVDHAMEHVHTGFVATRRE